MTTVSILIVNWNTKEFLMDCIDSIPPACMDIPYEVIIVDNASIDSSSQFIKQKYPSIKLVENRLNLGFARACNQAAKMAKGGYLFFLNPDTILHKETISRLVEFVEKESLAGAVSPQLLDRNGSPEDSVRRFPTMGRLLIRDTVLGKLLPWMKIPRWARNLPMNRASMVDQVSGAALLVNRELWERLGGMDERFFMFYEDVDLCKRIKDMGYNVFYLPTAKITHLGGGSRHQERSSVFYYSIKSKFLYLEKYNPRWKILLFKCIYKPLFLIKLGLNLISGNKKGRTKRDFAKKYLFRFLFL